MWHVDEASVGNVCVGAGAGVESTSDLMVAGRIQFGAVLVYERVDVELVYEVVGDGGELAWAVVETGYGRVGVGCVDEWVVAELEYDWVGVECGKVGVEEVAVADVKEGEHEQSFVKMQWDSESLPNYSVEQE